MLGLHERGNFDFKLDQEKLRKVLLRRGLPMEQKLTFISIESRSIESMLLLISYLDPTV